MPTPLRVLVDCPEGRSVELSAMNLGYFHQAFSLETSRKLRSVAADMTRRYPRGHVVMTVCSADTMSPKNFANDAVRLELQGTVDILRGAPVEIVSVIEGSGFAVAALRAASVALTRLLRGGIAMRFCSTGEEAADWIVRESAVRAQVPTRGEILEHLREIKRAAMDAHSARGARSGS